MEARPLTDHATAASFPRLLRDATRLDKLDPVWREFKTATGDATTVVFGSTSFPSERLRSKHSFTTATEPSQARTLPFSLDATEDQEEGLAALEIAAETGDEMAFIQAAGEIDWTQRSAAEFARAVRLALAAGAHLLARKLADYGHRLYPDHEELAKMARVLAPPRVVRADLPPDPSVRANRAWLQAHANAYKGRWVALRDGQLLAVGATVRELKEQLESTEGVLLTRVL